MGIVKYTIKSSIHSVMVLTYTLASTQWHQQNGIMHNVIAK